MHAVRNYLKIAVLSLNSGFALAYALFQFVSSGRSALNAPQSIRTVHDSFTGLMVELAPLRANQTAGALHRSWIVWEVTFVMIMLVASVLPFLVLATWKHVGFSQKLQIVLVGGLALLSVPACWLYFVRVTAPAFVLRGFGSVLLLELTGVACVVFLLRNGAFWFSAPVVLLHYAFCTVLTGGYSGATTLVEIPLSAFFPAAAIMWLRDLHAIQPRRASLR